MAKYYQDFVGLNTFIYEAVGYKSNLQEDVLLVDGLKDSISLSLNHFESVPGAIGNQALGLAIYKNNKFPFEISQTSSFFPALILHRNGPYGYPTWKQIRVGENPLTRRQRKENIMTIVEEPGDEFEFKRNGKHYRQRARRGSITLYENEAPILSKYKPVEVYGGIVSANHGLTSLIVRSSYGNETEFFNNSSLNDKVGRSMVESENYNKLTNMYLNGNLSSDSSPLDVFEVFKYRETVYPPLLYTYKNFIRQRTTFSFNWRDSRTDRQAVGVSNGFGTIVDQSIWPMDASTAFATASSTIGTNGINRYGYVEHQANEHESDYGILQNQYSFGQSSLKGNVAIGANQVAATLKVAPIYNRKHYQKHTGSMTANPGGMRIEGFDKFGTPFVDTASPIAKVETSGIPGGEAAWDTPSQAGRGPFYDSYGLFVQGPRQLGKDYTIIPEFRISNHIETYAQIGILSQSLNIFEITGGLDGVTDSSNQTFYTIFSNSDFLKKFDLVVEDHKDFSNPLAIKLKCKAIKKLLPYDGFYPQQRTVQIAQQFYDSYSASVSYSPPAGDFGLVSDDNAYLFQNLLTPIAAPGVLFNSIKSGVACDYPIITSSVSDSTSSADPRVNVFVYSSLVENHYLYRSGSAGTIWPGYSTFDQRIPFEALIEPEKHLSDKELYCNEPEPEVNTSGSCIWSGQGNQYYKLMMHNFLAETSNFFLKSKNYTKIVSNPSNDPKIKRIKDGSVWSMRVKMFKTFDGPNPANEDSGITYIPPQHRQDGIYESFTMYSRPTAFGPPSLPKVHRNASQTICFGQQPFNGENYPFTPPYYYGQAWADITFSASVDKDYTIPEIIRGSTVKYYRYVHDDHLYSSTTSDAYFKTQLYNTDAMQLSASVNLFSLQRDKSGDLNEETTRWIIQTKWETPMLNFNHLGASSSVTMPQNASESVPRGMWHQYGLLEQDPEKGIFLQVTDIPNTHIDKVIGGTGPKYATGSLADILGFSTDPVRLGQVAETKEISEAIVAVPFVEESGARKFFSIPRKDIGRAKGGSSLAGNSVISMVEKMRKYVFPPSMDFLTYNTIQPFAMYIFEFKHILNRQDLADIWQGVYPEVTEKMETAESSLSHQLLAHELLGGGAVVKQTADNNILSINERGAPFPNRIKWMVFKVKQRAEINYYNNIIGRNEQIPEVAVGPRGENVEVSYNWPYDYFSLVELAKIEAEVTLGELDAKPDTVVIKPYVGIRAEVPDQARESVSTGPGSAQQALGTALNSPTAGDGSGATITPEQQEAIDRAKELLEKAKAAMGWGQAKKTYQEGYDPNATYTCDQLQAFKDAPDFQGTSKWSASHRQKWRGCSGTSVAGAGYGN